MSPLWLSAHVVHGGREEAGEIHDPLSPVSPLWNEGQN